MRVFVEYPLNFATFPFSFLACQRYRKMPIPLFNSIASWLLKKRYHQIELFLKYPAEVQQEVLDQLLEIAEDT